MKTASRIRSVGLVLLMMTALLAVNAHAAIDSAGVLDNVTARYQAQAAAWSGAISAAATRLFWSLALISMVWTFGMMALRKADIAEVFAEMVRYVMFTGFFFFLLSNASAIASAIMNSLKQLGGDAAGVAGLTPSGIVDVGFKVFSTVIDNSSLWEPVDTAIGAFVAILILGMLALVAVNMVVLLVSGWILAYAGIFFLGFGGARWTSEIAINYYKTVLGVAASLMGMTLLVGIGQAVLNEYYLKMGNTTLKDLAVILVVAGMLLYLVNKIPALIAGIVTGASVGGAAGMGSAGTGTMMAAAAMAGAAAAGAAATMTSGAVSSAGWGSAIKAAMQQGGDSLSKDTGVGGMPNLPGTGFGGGDAGSRETAGTTTPLGRAMGDTKGMGLASMGPLFGKVPSDTPPPEGGSNEGGFAPPASNDSPAPGKLDRSALGALGAGIAGVTRGKARRMVDEFSHRMSQTTGGKVAAEIRSPGSAAAERQNQGDITRSQSVAGKAQAARAFMATGMASGSTPPAFTGDSFAAFNDPETSIDREAEIAALVDRRST